MVWPCLVGVASGSSSRAIEVFAGSILASPAIFNSAELVDVVVGSSPALLDGNSVATRIRRI